MKFKNTINFDRFEKNDFMGFLVVLIISSITAYILAINTEVVSIGFTSFSLGILMICISIYVYPNIRDKFFPKHKFQIDLGNILLRGIDGSKPRAIKRDLNDIIRRTKI